MAKKQNYCKNLNKKPMHFVVGFKNPQGLILSKQSFRIQAFEVKGL